MSNKYSLYKINTSEENKCNMSDAVTLLFKEKYIGIYIVEFIFDDMWFTYRLSKADVTISGRDHVSKLSDFKEKIITHNDYISYSLKLIRSFIAFNCPGISSYSIEEHMSNVLCESVNENGSYYENRNVVPFDTLFCKQCLTYHLDDEGICIDESRFVGETEVVLPNYIKGVPVTKINGGAFRYDRDMKIIFLPIHLSVIESDAFDSLHNLTDVMIGKEVKLIKKNAIRFCEKLEKVIVPDTTIIEDGAFDEHTKVIQTNCSGFFYYI